MGKRGLGYTACEETSALVKKLSGERYARQGMQILYNAKTDLLYLRLDDRKQEVVNKRLSEDVVLDLGEGDKIVGIEIVDASKHPNLERLLPVKYAV